MSLCGHPDCLFERDCLIEQAWAERAEALIDRAERLLEAARIAEGMGLRRYWRTVEAMLYGTLAERNQAVMILLTALDAQAQRSAR